MKKLYLLLASSRPLQAMFSVTQPLFAALLAAGEIPQLNTLALLILGSVCGMFSVFALNDFLDYRIDKRINKNRKKEWDVDSVMVLHPLSKGHITQSEQAIWIGTTGTIAALAIYLLNPRAVAFYFLAILLEAVYCKLARVSELKAIIAGTLVATGALIGWLAVGGGDNETLVVLLFLFFTWEIGGRNIPNDLSDIEGDAKQSIKTIPTVHGKETAARLIASFSSLTLIANGLLGFVGGIGLAYVLTTTAIGIVLLVHPALTLMKDPKPREALHYFNKASFYPVLIFLVLGTIQMLT